MPRIPTFTLKYDRINISDDIKPFLISINYTDKLEGESDELSVTLRNEDGRWYNSWFPEQGSILTLELGYEGEAMLGPVNFEIDEPSFRWAPDTVEIKGLATPVTASLRQQNTASFENTTLEAIARQIAEKHNLELVGSIPNITLKRVTQKEQSDLDFLRELAGEYGLIFKIEGATRLVFYSESELEEADAVLSISRGEEAADAGDIITKSGSLRKGTKGTYKAATISYQDPRSGKLIEITVKPDGTEATKAELENPRGEGEADIASGDVLKIRERVENEEQARIKAQEAIRRENRGKVEGSLDVEGNVLLSAGINITLKGVGVLGGKHQIRQVKHSLTKSSGYRSTVEIRQIEPEATAQA